MKLSQPQILLILASLVTLGLTWKTYQDEANADTVLPTRVLAEKQNNVVDRIDTNANLVMPDRPLVPLTGDLFARQYVKPKVYKRVLKKRVAKKKDTTVLPFKYLGRWQGKEKQVVMLDYYGELVIVKAGDVIANKYKVEAIDELAGRIQVKFLVMSLNTIQTLQARVGQP
ncbi:MAG: hypothetical protein ACKE5M_06300 [Methylophilaceae bacterium]